MQDVAAFVAHYLHRMRCGDVEDAFFRLIEADTSALPILIQAFDEPQNRDLRAEIVECVWQHRNPESIDFLARALDDADPDVWKQALDGLVTIAGPDAIRALEAARRHAATNLGGDGATGDWIDEALNQLRERD